MSLVQVDEHEDGVRVITLDDPDRRNIIGPELQTDLHAAVRRVRADAATTAVVVTGAGSAFCGGADLPAVFGDTGRSVAQLRDDLLEVYACFLALRDLSMPTIAAVQGPAVGAGLNLAMSCDLRVAGPDASFAATFSRIGLHPGGGCTWFLVQALGKERALQLLLDGGAMSGAEAVARGLAATLADDPLTAATEMAHRYARLDRQLAADIKRSVQIADDADLGSSLEFEAWAQASSATKPAIQEFVSKFRK
ncbi:MULTISPECIES: enoyl-CoA hydratase [unclassified Nocardioides]|uniref:enoyl-CoA hydratase n=1 Tax=unclassified Nocardioides TaxID=2615069 RepID=UPI00360DAB7E